MKEKQIIELAKKHIYEKLDFHENVVAGSQEEYSPADKDRQDLKECQIVLEWLVNFKR